MTAGHIKTSKPIKLAKVFVEQFSLVAILDVRHNSFSRRYGELEIDCSTESNRPKYLEEDSK